MSYLSLVTEKWRVFEVLLENALRQARSARSSRAKFCPRHNVMLAVETLKLGTRQRYYKRFLGNAES